MKNIYHGHQRTLAAARNHPAAVAVGTVARSPAEEVVHKAVVHLFRCQQSIWHQSTQESTYEEVDMTSSDLYLVLTKSRF